MGDVPAHSPSSGPSPFHVAIIGGGITGINLALGLRARAVPFTLYERAPGFREIGAGIGFSPNAEVAMNLLSPEILAAFKRVANPNGEDWFQFADGYSGGDGLMDKLYVGKDGFQGCRRSDILEEWARQLPEEEGVVKFGREVVSVTEIGEGGVEVEFKGGERERASVVVACDGIRSRVRAGLFPGSPATFTGKECFRALVPMEKAVEAIGEKKAGTRWMYLGRDGHVVTYPVGGSTLLNVVCWVWSCSGRIGWLLTWNSSLSSPRRTPGPTRQSTQRLVPGARSTTPSRPGPGARQSGPSPGSCRKPWISGASST
jgi:salicylate hydroxylase